MIAPEGWVIVGETPCESNEQAMAHPEFSEAAIERFEQPGPFDKTLPITHFPEFGKVLREESKGTIEYLERFEGGLLGKLSLEGLDPNQCYRLALNGNPERKGNKLLPTPVAGLEDEFYYDFLDFESDAQGRYSMDFALKLLPGEYDVRLYVKDSSDWKIVLYREFFEFEVL